jgi:UDP-N-acetylmuramoyl-L-alanyl-D-glutamate--2,6-diaminopimelate ligase
LAQANDIILVAGKGHETYQEIQGVRYEFDDMQHLKDLFIQLQK